jgi:hypothetical protein
MRLDGRFGVVAGKFDKVKKEYKVTVEGEVGRERRCKVK